MNIHLPEDLEQIVHDAVRTGHYARPEDVIRDALVRLKQALPERAEATARGAEPAREGKPLTKEEFHRQLVEIGLMSQLPDTAADFEDPEDQLIDIEGEPLSETVIRERR
jgi:Arc/MetJ-type ribon-helix-helix transcriptional regulator